MTGRDHSLSDIATAVGVPVAQLRDSQVAAAARRLVAARHRVVEAMRESMPALARARIEADKALEALVSVVDAEREEPHAPDSFR